MNFTRAYLAQAIVRNVGSGFDASYNAWVRYDKGEVSKGYHEWWFKQAKRREKYLLPIALKLNKEAETDQMVEEGWWG